MWRWIFITLGWLWYSWRIYTLTVNWATFPNPEAARAIWQKRSNFSLWLSAAVLNDTLYTVGAIERWWVIAVSFGGCFLVMAVVQPFLIPTILMFTMRYRTWKSFHGKDPRDTLLGDLAIWQYLDADEKRAYKQRIKAEK
jgi:hypothetical protein